MISYNEIVILPAKPLRLAFSRILPPLGISFILFNSSFPSLDVIAMLKLFTGITCSPTERTVKPTAAGLSNVTLDSAPGRGELGFLKLAFRKTISKFKPLKEDDCADFKVML